MAAAFGPVDEVLAALVRHGLPVVIERERRSESIAVLADHADGEPAVVLRDVRDALVDLADRRRVAQHEIDLSVEVTIAVQVTQPVDLLGAYPKCLERREIRRRVITREVGCRGGLRRRDVGEWPAHVLRPARLLLQGLRVHRVVVVDGEDVSDAQTAFLECPIERVGDDRPAKTGDRYGTRWRLRIADHMLAVVGKQVCFLIRPEARLVTLLRSSARHALAGLYAQLTARIFISMVPAGTDTLTVSPARRPCSARPTGDSLLILPSCGDASADPTMVYFSLRPSASTVTWLPTSTMSCFEVSSMIWAFLIICSRVMIRPSRNAWSFLACSSSEFSVKSPNSMAAWMRCATSVRLLVRSSSSSACSFFSPSAET